MRILYGVCSEGMGHATRAGVVIESLAERGHEVKLVSSGAPLRYLQKLFPTIEVFPTTGLSIEKTRGRIDDLGTIASNLWKQAIGSVQSAASFLEAAAVWRPNVVVSDFDAFSARVAHASGAPLVCVDNINLYGRCSHPAAVTSAVPPHALGAGLFVSDAMTPFARRYLIPSCFPGLPKHADTQVYPAILRKKVISAKSSAVHEHGKDAHLTVYPGQVPVPHDALSALSCDSHVWVPNLDLPFSNGRVTYYPFSEDAFIRDLGSARAVICSAGHSLLSEAAYLGVPMLAVPLKGQYEQELNAAYVEYLSWGEAIADPASLDWQRIGFFLERSPHYAETLSRLPAHDENESLLHALDLELASVT